MSLQPLFAESQCLSTNGTSALFIFMCTFEMVFQAVFVRKVIVTFRTLEPAVWKQLHYFITYEPLLVIFVDIVKLFQVVKVGVVAHKHFVTTRFLARNCCLFLWQRTILFLSVILLEPILISKIMIICNHLLTEI